MALIARPALQGLPAAPAGEEADAVVGLLPLLEDASRNRAVERLLNAPSIAGAREVLAPAADAAAATVDKVASSADPAAGGSGAPLVPVTPLLGCAS